MIVCSFKKKSPKNEEIRELEVILAAPRITSKPIQSKFVAHWKWS